MLHKIKNDIIAATINDIGAELISLKYKNIDILNDPLNSTWNRVSPILFPVISKIKDDSYYVNKNIHKISKHGFARNLAFDVIVKENNNITFKLSSNIETFNCYPFNFELYVSYLLVDDCLKANIKVKNIDNQPIYYMIGGHPGFKIPFYENEKYEDYYLKFECNEVCSNRLVINGSISNEYIDFLKNENIINLNHNLFKDDALILNNLKSTYVDIKSKNHDEYIRFFFNKFEALAIWANTSEKTKFVCLEPWSGININYQTINEKIGSNKLNINEEQNYSYIIQMKRG